MRWAIFNFGDLVWLVLEIWWYMSKYPGFGSFRMGAMPIQHGPIKPQSHMFCNLSATALGLKTAATNATTVRSKLQFFGCRSIGNWSATTIPKSRRPVEDRSAIDCQLIGNGLRLVGNWLATGRWQVADGLATDYRSNNLLCRCNHDKSFDELL